jgi:hypothetical protein
MKIIPYLSWIGIFLLGYHTSRCQQQDTIPPYIKGKTATGVRVTDTLGPGQRNDTGVLRGKGHKDSPYKVDSAAKKLHDPRKATLYSTFCPGLGQIYNKKYWKLPIVYAAIGIPAYTYFYNKSWYQKCQYALAIIDNGTTNVDSLNRVDPKLKTFIVDGDDNSLRSYRNQFRQDQDYSVLILLLLWGLQIVDATVDAHLMGFDISPQLSMRIEEGGSGTSNNSTGLGPMNTATSFSLVFDLHKTKYKTIALP